MGKIIDLSHHQGTIDFAKASKEIDLAIIRVQYGSSSIDKKYKEYVAGCKKYNIPFGHYAYARFKTISDAIQEANDFISRADKDAKFLVVDVEEMTLTNPSDIVPATQAFIDTCKRKGFKIGLYTGHSFYKQYKMDKVKSDFLWIPRYSSSDNGNVHSVKPDMECDLWQYTQCGKVSGIKGSVDLNVLNGLLALDWFKNNKVTEASIPKKQVNKGSGRVMNLTDSQWKEIASSYKKAYDDKLLSSDEWYVKAQNKTLTIDEATFVNAVLIKRG